MAKWVGDPIWSGPTSARVETCDEFGLYAGWLNGVFFIRSLDEMRASLALLKACRR